MSTWKTHADWHNIQAWIVSCRSAKGGSSAVWLWLNLGKRSKKVEEEGPKQREHVKDAQSMRRLFQCIYLNQL